MVMGLVIAGILSSMLIGDNLEGWDDAGEVVDYSFSRYIADKSGLIGMAKLNKIFHYKIDQEVIAKELAFTNIRLDMGGFNVRSGRVTIKNLKADQFKVLSEIDLDINNIEISNKIDTLITLDGNVFVNNTNIKLNILSRWVDGGEAEINIGIIGNQKAISEIISRFRWLLHSGGDGIMKYIYAIVGQDGVEVDIKFRANNKLIGSNLGWVVVDSKNKTQKEDGISRWIGGNKLSINYKNNNLELLVSGEAGNKIELSIQDVFQVDGIWSSVNENQIINKLNIVIENPVLLAAIITGTDEIKKIRDKVIEDSTTEIELVSYKDEEWFGMTPGVTNVWHELYSKAINNNGIVVVDGDNVGKKCGESVIKHLLTDGRKRNIFRDRGCNTIWNKLVDNIKSADSERKKEIDKNNNIPARYQELVRLKLRKGYSDIAKKLSAQFGVVRADILDFLISPKSIKINSDKAGAFNLLKLKDKPGWVLDITTEDGDWQDVEMTPIKQNIYK